MQPELDRLDREILSALVNDGRASVEKVAEIVGLSPTPTRRRIRQLEKAGVIKGYRAVVDPEKCGLGLAMHVLVTLKVGDAEIMSRFEAEIMKLPEVQRCDLIAGENCYILSMFLPDMKFYNTYLRNTLVNLPGVFAVETRTVIGSVKDSAQLPLF